MRFRKKPIEVEAFRLGVDPIPDWFMDRVSSNEVFLGGGYSDPHADIRTPEGLMRAFRSDWIIKGVKGEIYPCKADIFEMTYEPVSNDLTSDLSLSPGRTFLTPFEIAQGKLEEAEKALENIVRCECTFRRDPLEHAREAVEHCRRLAKDALAGLGAEVG